MSMPLVRFRWFLFLLVISAPLLLSWERVNGTPSTIPNVTTETLVGVWEALNPMGPELCQLEVHNGGPSYVAIANGSGESAEAMVLLVSEMHVIHGKLELKADSLDKSRTYSLTIRASGRASHGWGLMEGTIALQDRVLRRSVRRWTSSFVMTEGGYAANLARLSSAASKGIQAVASAGR